MRAAGPEWKPVDTGETRASGGDWARYWRAADSPLEAMHAHFERHVYHRHSHDTYSLGVTDGRGAVVYLPGRRPTRARPGW